MEHNSTNILHRIAQVSSKKIVFLQLCFFLSKSSPKSPLKICSQQCRLFLACTSKLFHYPLPSHKATFTFLETCYRPSTSQYQLLFQLIQDAIRKLSFMEWLIKKRNIFLTFLEVGKYKIKVLADAVSNEDPIPGSQMIHFLIHLLAMSTHGRRGKGTLSDLFNKGTSPTNEGSTLMTDSSLENPTSKVITLEEQVTTQIWAEHIHSIPLPQHRIYLVFYLSNFLILYAYENSCQSQKHKNYITQVHCVRV